MKLSTAQQRHVLDLNPQNNPSPPSATCLCSHFSGVLEKEKRPTGKVKGSKVVPQLPQADKKRDHIREQFEEEKKATTQLNRQVSAVEAPESPISQEECESTTKGSKVHCRIKP
jgi:hypothetical protein